jgi:hypothetical protein
MMDGWMDGWMMDTATCDLWIPIALRCVALRCVRCASSLMAAEFWILSSKTRSGTERLLSIGAFLFHSYTYCMLRSLCKKISQVETIFKTISTRTMMCVWCVVCGVVCVVCGVVCGVWCVVCGNASRYGRPGRVSSPPLLTSRNTEIRSIVASSCKHCEK